MQLRKTLVVLIACLASLALAGTVMAAQIDSSSGGAYIRAQPTTDSAQYGYFANGTQLTLNCYRDASWAEGTNRWFQVNVPSYQYGSPEAYINANLVSDQYDVGPCP